MTFSLGKWLCALAQEVPYLKSREQLKAGRRVIQAVAQLVAQNGDAVADRIAVEKRLRRNGLDAALMHQI